MSSDPHVVANYLKKVLKYMGEPLCTYKLYTKFRDLSGINYSIIIFALIDVKLDERP